MTTVPTSNRLDSYGRLECQQMLAMMFVRARRFRSPLTLMIVRTEQIERLGAMFGASSARAVVTALSAYLVSQVRGGDVVARWDASSFAVLLPGTAAEQAMALARKLQHGIGEGFFGGFGCLSCAIGLGDSSRYTSASALADATVRQTLPGAPVLTGQDVAAGAALSRWHACHHKIKERNAA